MTDAILVLQDGTVYTGDSFGSPAQIVGEVVFNTSMSGYQEILTDPSYAGQIVTLTQPHIGNYGISPCDMESERIHAAGLVVRDLSDLPSNYRSEETLAGWLERHGVPGISGIDTRSLTRKIREGGVTMGLIATHTSMEQIPVLLEQLKAAPSYGDIDFVSLVTVPEPTPANVLEHANGQMIVAERAQGSAHCVVIDFGVKYSILKYLVNTGFQVTRVPFDASVQEIMALSPDGVLVSNGPGDPAQLDAQLQTIRELAQQCPTWGICLGHQLISRAFGGETFKLPYGHRGPNQPVQELRSARVAMTSQNHGYAVASDSMPDCFEVTHINLNDGTVEGIRHVDLAMQAVQYHPEAGPGPHDAQGFFEEFFRCVVEHR